jgi:hypothetical protein
MSHPIHHSICVPGLQDGTVSNQKSLFGYILEGLGMEKVGILFGHLKYITAIYYILWPFGNLVAVWYILPRFGILCKDNSGNPDVNFEARPRNGRKLVIIETCYIKFDQFWLSALAQFGYTQ